MFGCSIKALGTLTSIRDMQYHNLQQHSWWTWEKFCSPMASVIWWACRRIRTGCRNRIHRLRDECEHDCGAKRGSSSTSGNGGRILGFLSSLRQGTIRLSRCHHSHIQRPCHRHPRRDRCGQGQGQD
jgi:hypothetical protein